MADIYEFVLAMDLRADLPDAELAEVRWHLGLGPRPETLTIVPADPFEEPIQDPAVLATIGPGPYQYQLLHGRGGAYKIHGALVSELVARPNQPGWALTTRQELHPDAFNDVRHLVDWLAQHGDYPYLDKDGMHQGGCGHVVGHVRFYQANELSVITIRGGAIEWPEEFLKY
jgi:hypothetical protein